MADEKDRMGDKIHDAEKAREDQWARQRDEELLHKIRRKATTKLHCPRCGNALEDQVQGGVNMLACPQYDGAWIEASALENLLKK